MKIGLPALSDMHWVSDISLSRGYGEAQAVDAYFDSGILKHLTD